MTVEANMTFRLNQVLEAINKKQQEKEYLLVAIDGRCAAGKTTMASYLAKKLSCNCIHMDDFFLQPMQRTPKRLDEPGGNVDYERFLEEVLLPLSLRKSFSFRPFQCKTMEFGEPISVELNSITIIEGSYACHPQLIEYYDLRIFLSVDQTEQLRRIEKRNGMKAALMFFQKWIPLEEKYIKAFQVPDHCDMAL
ncbi:MAG TPA: uridine kinase [Lachnospiraceae bacterium]|nr:uridine kinase [Lachnospiraceae bacterium]